MSEQATGTLTFLLTDVEGSTPLWERHEATMRAVTARHDALLDALITAHDGQCVRERGEGDSLFAVFARPHDAVAAALAMAQAVQAEPWPAETPIRVRMGLHSGLAQYRDGDYYGPVVNRCARIRGLGHGGQVLLSATASALVRDALPDGASLRSLGLHSLKGLSAPEEVYQLCHSTLPTEFPPLLSPQAPRHNLPPALTTLIGRDAEQGEVLSLLAAARLVTLTGSGGVGKTRLALVVAAELVDQYADGVWLVELASLSEPSLVPGAVAQALGVREEPGRPLMTTLIDHLKDKRLLLLLDNCEHLVGACADLAAALLRACPGVRLLATSREGLEIAGERRWRVPSLSVPDPRNLPPPELTGSYEAVRLFVARARERRVDFALSAKNVLAVASICARLDGIPLAIELAAARVGSLSVEGLAARLDDCFRLLTSGARDALPRQRTLRAALDWSYDLLADQEQMLLDRLSVFAGGCTLAAAEAICAGDGVDEEAVLDLLDSLVHKSLMQAEEADGELRYGLLETVRQYGQERLAECGEATARRAVHAQYFLALAEAAAPRLRGPEQVRWLGRLEMEHDNLRAALSWSREHAAPENALRLSGALWRFWQMHGHLSEGRRWLEQALDSSEVASALARATALHGAGVLAYNQGDYSRAAALHAEALALRRELNDTLGIADSLHNLGIVAFEQGDYSGATALYEEALALRRELGDTRGIAASLTNLGNVAGRRGNYGRAGSLQAEALGLYQELRDIRGSAGPLNNLGVVAFEQGDYGRAADLHAEALAVRREVGDKAGIANSLNNLGNVAQQQGDYGRAADLHSEALTLCRTIGDRRLSAYCLEGLAAVAGAHGQPERAARLFGAAEATRRLINAPIPPNEQPRYERLVAVARAQLDEEEFAAAWAAGQAVPLEQAIAEALSSEEAIALAREEYAHEG